MARIGIIGGSGLYNIEGLENVKELNVETPFGRPSDKFATARFEGKDVVFLPRHGKGHTIPPSGLNYRANIFAMKKLGVDRIISVSAVGSLKKEIEPLDMLVVSQFVDRTNQARPATFFDNGIVAHIPFAEPVCPRLSKTLLDAGNRTGARMHPGGTYINMEGPAFSTMAESYLYKSWGMDVIGMTNMPEARLAREAEICYATLAMVTDYDCWCLTEEGCTVTVDLILENLRKNTETAKKLIREALRNIPDGRDCPCGSALKDAIVTPKQLIPKKKKRELGIIIGKYT
jgi:5'-methylthioadenosine phosphorylase